MHVLINMPPVEPPTTRHPGHWTCHRVILLFTLSIIMLLGFVVLGGGTSMLSVYRQGDTRRCIYIADMVMQSDTKRDLLHELVTAWQCDLTAGQLPVTVRALQQQQLQGRERDPPLCEGGLLSRLHRGVVGTIATGVALALAALCGYAGVFANKSAPLAIYMVVTLVLVLLELGAVGILVYNKSELDKIQPHADFLLSQPAAERLVTPEDGLLTAGGPLPTRRLPSARAGAGAAEEDFGGFRPPPTRPPLGGFAPPPGHEPPPPPPPPAVDVEGILIKIAGRRSKSGKASKMGDLAPRVKANAIGEKDEKNVTSSPYHADVVPYDLGNVTETEHVDFVPLGDVSPSPSYHNSSVLPYDLSKRTETGDVNGNASAERISTGAPRDIKLGNSEKNRTKDAALNEAAVTYAAISSKSAEESPDVGPGPNTSSSLMLDAVGGGTNSTAVPVEETRAGMLSVQPTGSPLKSSTVTRGNQTADAEQVTDVYISSEKDVAPYTLTAVHHIEFTQKAELADKHETTSAPVHHGKQHIDGTLPPPSQPNSNSSDHHRSVHSYHDVAPEPFTDTSDHKVTDNRTLDKAATRMPIPQPQTYEAVDPGPNSYYGTFTKARYLEDYEGSNATRTRRRRSKVVHVATEEAEAVVNHWAAASIQCSPPDATPLDVPCFAKLENNLQTELERAELLVELLLTPLVCAFLACVLQLATLCATWHLIKDQQRMRARRPPGPARPTRPDTAV